METYWYVNADFIFLVCEFEFLIWRWIGLLIIDWYVYCFFFGAI